jgi:hypothetical protein
MISKVFRSIAAVAALTGVIAIYARPAAAQVPGTPTKKAAQAPAAVTTVTEDPNAERTREQFMELLQKYPPSLGRVLKLDTSLLGNTDYLATYPALASFLAQHPEVPRSPAYYLERVRAGNEYVDTRSDTSRIWQELLDWIGGLTIATIVATSLGWVIRLVVDYRRWSRLSKVQAEVHNKLLDRMTANEELIAYVQSPAGTKFLESAPIALEPGTRRVGAPFGRILWSIQTGLVLGAGGIGFQYVSSRIITDASQPLFVLGVLGVALGIGFVASSVVSYALSRRLGLIEAPAKQTDQG